MVAERNPTIRKAVNTLYEISSDEEVRAKYEWKQKARMDTEAIIITRYFYSVITANT